MPSPPLVNEGKIPLIKMKIARQLHVIGFCNIATIMALLQIVGGDKLIIPFC